jgi:hypothetical protein
MQALMPDAAAYIRINMLDFLKMTKGSALMLNPGSDFGKEITAEEAAAIIEGSIWSRTTRRRSQSWPPQNRSSPGMPEPSKEQSAGFRAVVLPREAAKYAKLHGRWQGNVSGC